MAPKDKAHTRMKAQTLRKTCSQSRNATNTSSRVHSVESRCLVLWLFYFIYSNTKLKHYFKRLQHM